MGPTYLHPGASSRGRRGLLGDRYPLHNLSLHLFAGGTDPAYSAAIYLNEVKEPKDLLALTFHVSLLGPYYGIHLPRIPEAEPVVREVVREIESTYPGYQRIPPELGDEVVPDLYNPSAYFGVATIYVCLFSMYWTGF